MILIGCYKEKVKKSKSHLPLPFRFKLANSRVTTTLFSPLRKPCQSLSVLLLTEDN